MRSVFWVLFWSLVLGEVTSQDEPSCDSLVYCQGNLLDTVQMAGLFNDSKSFVDMRMINSVNETLDNFAILIDSTNNNPTKADVAKFVQDNFNASDDLEDWVPSDYNPNPKFLQKITDPEVRKFAQEIVSIWLILARRIKDEVIEKPEQYSLIPVNNGFIIPGGRFKEFYYWDSYWIIKGLIISEMTTTVKGMLDNFVSLVERYGFIPNGARVYYLNRSQPPLLTLMADLYIKATNDWDWLEKNLKFLDQEARFWLDKKTTTVKKDGTTYNLAHYDSESGSPRPESYSEDVRTAQYYSDESEKKRLFANLKSGAESGWDFSSRWIVDDKGGNAGNISKLATRQIIPVDLNAILYKVFDNLSSFYILVGDIKNAVFWREKASLWRKSITQVFYHEEDGIWYDYDKELETPRRYFYLSNLVPLWVQAYDPLQSEIIGQKAADYLKTNGILEFPGGIPTSLENTREQWDLPNAWAPLQSMAIFGLDKTGNCDAVAIAETFAERWINANMIGFNRTTDLFEKYDAENPGQYGAGGEYQPQVGFGWTNGAALELIQEFYTGDN